MYCLQFHTEALTALLADDNKFGFIVMDGNGALFGTLQGNTREVLHKFTVDLPKKHGMWIQWEYDEVVQIIISLSKAMYIHVKCAIKDFDFRQRRSVRVAFCKIKDGEAT